MKVFVSYAFTGEDYEVLKKRLSGLRGVFSELDLDFYINTFAPEWQAMMDRGATGGEFLHYAFKELESSDVVLVLMTSPRRSEGMLMEVGAGAWLGKKMILAQHTSAVGATYLPTVVEQTFVWNSEQELLDKAKAVLGDRLSRVG